MKRRSISVLVFALALCAMLVPIAQAQQNEPETAPKQITLTAAPAPQNSTPPGFAGLTGSDYRIGFQDLLEISVFGVDELSQTVRVSDDGSISMPLLGRLKVAGKTKSELQQQIADLLSERYVREPQVTVFIKEYESKKVAVTGAVKKPGTFEMLGQKTLLEMISMAGGLDIDTGKEVVIFRKSADGAGQRIPIDLERLVFAADPALNVAIYPQDIVYVPTLERVRIFVSGAVKNPDVYEVPRNEPVTVLKAVTLAGGTTDRAAEKKVQVMRDLADGSRVTLVVNLRKIKRGRAEDPILEEGDLVLVPEAFF